LHQFGNKLKESKETLCGVGARRRKIAWVFWETICKSKNEGGLGVKDLRMFNIALLAK